MMYGYYGNHMGAGGWIAMTFTALAFWVVLGAVAVWALRSFRATTSRGPQMRTPTEVLAHRFARGEIDAEEYAARLRVLQERERP